MIEPSAGLYSVNFKSFIAFSSFAFEICIIVGVFLACQWFWNIFYFLAIHYMEV